MKRIALVLALALSLSGCASFSGISTAIGIATTPITVTPQMVYDAENGLKVAASGLVAYRRLCISKVIDPVTRNCRVVIATIQPFTIAARQSIIDMRSALKANDQVTAITAYKALMDAIKNVQAERQKAGV